MLTSLALIFLLGMLMGSIMNKLHLPPLLGMLITGIILSPYALNLLDDSILSISPDLRQIALVIILTRAGLALNISDLKKVGRPAILMCFVPAIFEIAGMTILAPMVFGISTLEGAILGTVIAAVSPAVIVPKMLILMDKGYGKDKSIPQLIMAGASVDDIFVIVLFTAFTGLAQGSAISFTSFIQIPISIATGFIIGIAVGVLLCIFFKKVHLRDTAKVFVILSVAFLLIQVEDMIPIPFSALLAVMAMGIAILKNYEVLAKRLSVKFSKLWIGAEILLFVLVGATVDIGYAVSAGAKAIVLIFLVLVFRMIGVFICMIKTQLTVKERLFCMIAYMPKATVQAAIGGLPLAMGLACGELVLTVAVLAIIITAPLGAFGIERTYKRFLSRDSKI